MICRSQPSSQWARGNFPETTTAIATLWQGGWQCQQRGPKLIGVWNRPPTPYRQAYRAGWKSFSTAMREASSAQTERDSVSSVLHLAPFPSTTSHLQKQIQYLKKRVISVAISLSGSESAVGRSRGHLYPQLVLLPAGENSEGSFMKAPEVRRAHLFTCSLYEILIIIVKFEC